MPSHLEVNPPPRNIVASPEPSESSNSRRSSQTDTPTRQTSALSSPALGILPSPIAYQIAKGTRDSDMSPGPAVTSLDEMDEDTVVFASTDSSNRDAAEEDSSDDDDTRNPSNTLHSDNNSKSDRPLHVQLVYSETSLTSITSNATTDTETSEHALKPPYDPEAGFSIGFAEDRNRRHRRTMEDAHAFISNFADVKGQGVTHTSVMRLQWVFLYSNIDDRILCRL